MTRFLIGPKMASIALATLAIAACDDSAHAACEPYQRDQALATTQVQTVNMTPRMSCVIGVAFQGKFYTRTNRQSSDIGKEIPGVVTPGCNDTGGTSEPDVPKPAYQMGNYCASDVLIVGDSEWGTVYIRER